MRIPEDNFSWISWILGSLELLAINRFKGAIHLALKMIPMAPHHVISTLINNLSTPGTFLFAFFDISVIFA